MRSFFLLLTAVLFFSGCTASHSSRVIVERKGVIIDTRLVEIPGYASSSALLGAAAGGAIGHQFGKGKGKKAATIAGALIGYSAGAYAARKLGQVIRVRVPGVETFDMQIPYPYFKKGDRVRVFYRNGFHAYVQPL